MISAVRVVFLLQGVLAGLLHEKTYEPTEIELQNDLDETKDRIADGKADPRISDAIELSEAEEKKLKIYENRVASEREKFGKDYDQITQKTDLAIERNKEVYNKRQQSGEEKFESKEDSLVEKFVDKSDKDSEDFMDTFNHGGDEDTVDAKHSSFLEEEVQGEDRYERAKKNVFDFSDIKADMLKDSEKVEHVRKLSREAERKSVSRSKALDEKLSNLAEKETSDFDSKSHKYSSLLDQTVEKGLDKQRAHYDKFQAREEKEEDILKDVMHIRNRPRAAHAAHASLLQVGENPFAMNEMKKDMEGMKEEMTTLGTMNERLQKNARKPVDKAEEMLQESTSKINGEIKDNDNKLQDAIKNSEDKFQGEEEDQLDSFKDRIASAETTYKEAMAVPTGGDGEVSESALRANHAMRHAARESEEDGDAESLIELKATGDIPHKLYMQTHASAPEFGDDRPGVLKEKEEMLVNAERADKTSKRISQADEKLKVEEHRQDEKMDRDNQQLNERVTSDDYDFRMGLQNRKATFENDERQSLDHYEHKERNRLSTFESAMGEKINPSTKEGRSRLRSHIMHHAEWQEEGKIPLDTGRPTTDMTGGAETWHFKPLNEVPSLAQTASSLIQETPGEDMADADKVQKQLAALTQKLQSQADGYKQEAAAVPSSFAQVDSPHLSGAAWAMAEQLRRGT